MRSYGIIRSDKRKVFAMSIGKSLCRTTPCLRIAGVFALGASLSAMNAGAVMVVGDANTTTVVTPTTTTILLVGGGGGAGGLSTSTSGYNSGDSRGGGGGAGAAASGVSGGDGYGCDITGVTILRIR